LRLLTVLHRPGYVAHRRGCAPSSDAGPPRPTSRPTLDACAADQGHATATTRGPACGHGPMTDRDTPETRRAMRADIRQVVFDRLTTGAWAPGERVSIEALARELGVSPTPVREALVSLERSGLIQYRAQRGYVAAPPLDEQQIVEVLDARLVGQRAGCIRAFRSSWEDLAARLDAVHRAHVEAAERL